MVQQPELHHRHRHYAHRAECDAHPHHARRLGTAVGGDDEPEKQQRRRDSTGRGEPGSEVGGEHQEAALAVVAAFTTFPGHLHRSAMMHFSHSGRRAMQV